MPPFWKLRVGVLVTIISLAAGVSPAEAGFNIYVMGSNTYPDSVAARDHLTSLGHNVTFGGNTTLSDYSGYDQVWDLRYDINLTAADIAAMDSYLEDGGRMYLTGEHTGFDSARNGSLVNWAQAVGAGEMVLDQAQVSGPQDITTAGQIVNSPNSFSSIDFGQANTTTAATLSQGFLVSEFQGTNSGSLVGWNFGDITGANGARMLMGFDINIFQNGQDWTENMVTYLGASQEPEPMPTPPSAVLMAIGAVGLIGFRAYRRRNGSEPDTLAMA